MELQARRGLGGRDARGVSTPTLPDPLDADPTREPPTDPRRSGFTVCVVAGIGKARRSWGRGGPVGCAGCGLGAKGDASVAEVVV